MKIICISDTHTHHKKIQLPSGDVIIHAGDFSRKGTLSDIRKFAKWYGETPFKYKIVIAGNHDFGFENEDRGEAEKLLADNGIVYLNDSGIIIDGINFWGSPVQPTFHNWAFNRDRGNDIKMHWDLIPADTDVLITHGPPKDILDLCAHGERVGCADLLDAVERVRPKYHIFGHIHEAYGEYKTEFTTFVNPSIVDERYQLKNKPILITV